MNPGDLVDSRRMVVQGLDAHTPTATATMTTTSSSSTSPIASAFTPLEERTLSFAPHFFYERRVRQERPRSAAERRTTKKRRRVATQEPEESREVDEFGRDVDRKRRKKEGKKEKKKQKKQKQEEDVEETKASEQEETEKEVQQREEVKAEEQGGLQEERRGMASGEGFNIETPLGLAVLPPADLLLLLHYGTMSQSPQAPADGYAATQNERRK
jgi:hypothetical protein